MNVTKCRPETRTCEYKVCKYVNEPQTKEVQYTVCVPEQQIADLHRLPLRVPAGAKDRQLHGLRPRDLHRASAGDRSARWSAKQIEVPACGVAAAVVAVVRLRLQLSGGASQSTN